MRFGVPTEIKTDVYRVALTPAGVRELVDNGQEVLIQAGAGAGSAIALPAPAPDSIRTWCPCSASSRAPAGVRATRYSSGLISVGTPTLMMGPEFP